MKRMLFMMGLVLFASGQAFAARPGKQAAEQKTSSSQTPNARIIGNIKNFKMVEGCGCNFQTPQERKKKSYTRFVFWNELEEPKAWMNIDGRDMKLRLVSSKDPRGREKKGSRSSRQYKAGDTTVQIDRVATQVCDPKDEGCEVTFYDATITVTKGSRKQTIKVTGDCGC